MPSKSAAAGLVLELHSDLVVLTPNIRHTRLDPSNSSDADADELGRPRHDTNLRGTATLILSREARYEKIVVELVHLSLSNTLHDGANLANHLFPTIQIYMYTGRKAGDHHRFSLSCVRYAQEKRQPRPARCNPPSWAA